MTVSEALAYCQGVVASETAVGQHLPGTHGVTIIEYQRRDSTFVTAHTSLRLYMSSMFAGCSLKAQR